VSIEQRTISFLQVLGNDKEFSGEIFKH